MPRPHPRFGADMGITAMIPDMTLGQLTNEVEARWGEIWDENAARMLILLMCPRKERKLMELHGDMVEHGQPVLFGQIGKQIQNLCLNRDIQR